MAWPIPHDTASTVKANITQEEAAARRQAVRGASVSYDMHLDLSRGTSYTGRVRIGFSVDLAKVPDTGLFLDFTGEQLQVVTLNGSELSTVTWKDHRLTVPKAVLSEDKENELVIEYTNKFDTNGAGLHRFQDPVDSEVYVYANFEPFDAHRMLPCFDQPDIKGALRTTITAPADWLVLANGAVESCDPVEGDRKLWKFVRFPPISTYIFGLTAGPFVGVQDATDDGIQLGWYCRNSLKPFLDKQCTELFTVTKQGLKFLADYFAVPYPFGKYDQVFCPEFNCGAMEVPGAVTYTENYLFQDDPTAAECMGRADTILHEMTHMWFGDLVTMQWWNGLWLNESFASYMSAVAVAGSTAYGDNIWMNFNSKMKQWAYREDQLSTTHCIQDAVPDAEATFLNFDGITYGKGASALQQLVVVIGEPAFKAGMRAYFAKHAWGNTSVSDLLNALQEAAGSVIDIHAWADQWFSTAGLNTVVAEWTSEGSGDAMRISKFAILQSASPAHPTLRTHKLKVGFILASGDVHVATVVVQPTERTELPELTGFTVPNLVAVVLNWDDVAYVKTRFDDLSAANLWSVLNPVGIKLTLNRCLAWAALYDMVRDALLPADVFLQRAATVLPQETDAIVLRNVIRPAIQPALYNFLPYDQYVKHTTTWFHLSRDQTIATIGDHRLSWLRLMFGCVASKELAQQLLDFVDSSQDRYGFSIPQSLRWAAITEAVAFDVPGWQERLEAESKKDTTDRGQRSAATCAIVVPDAKVKEEAWTKFCNPDPSESYYALEASMSGFWQKHQLPLLRKYTPLFFEAVEGVFVSQPREVAAIFFDNLCPSDDDERTLPLMAALVARLQASETADKTLLRSAQETVDALTRKYKCRELVARL